MKPNLFIVGASKCGTTAWVHYLSSHPAVFFCTPKEPHHFCYDFPNYGSFKTLDSYLRLFDQSGSATVVGEASVKYLYSREAARAIHDFNPASRIIILVRRQEEFIPSLHNQLMFNGYENIRDCGAAWRLSGKRNGENAPAFCPEITFLDYKATGRFGEQVERFYDCFPPEQIRVFHFDDWTTDPRRTYLQILEFLGVEDDGRTTFPRVNLARRQRIAWLRPLLRRPPTILRGPLRLFKRVTGRGESLRSKLLAFNAVETPVAPISDALKSEIRAYFEHDNSDLEKRLTKVTLGSKVLESVASPGAGPALGEGATVKWPQSTPS